MPSIRAIPDRDVLYVADPISGIETDLECGVMLREFKPLRLFVMMGIAAFVVCGVAAFYTHRTAHGRTAEERAAYWLGEKAGEQAPRDAKLPSPAELNMMVQKCFEQQGSGNKQDCSLAFEKGYKDGFKKTHPRQ